MVVRELFVKLGLKPDAASIAEGFGVIELLKAGMEVVAEKAKEAREFLIEQVKATTEAGHEAELMASRLGLTAREVQKLQYVGAQAHVSLEEMAAGMRHMASLGVRDLHQGLFALADRIKNTRSEGEKLALAQHMLGRSGNALLPVLSGGSARIRELYEEAEQLGVVMSEEDIEATRDFEQQSVRLSQSLGGLRNTVFLPLMPVLQKFALWLTNLVVRTRQWVSLNITSESGLKRLTTQLKIFGETLAAVLAGWALLTYGAAIWAAITAGITAAWTALAGISVMDLIIGAQWAAFGFYWVLLAAGIALVVLWVQDFFTWINGGDSVIGRAINAWMAHFSRLQDILETIRGLFLTITDALGFKNLDTKNLQGTRVPLLEQGVQNANAPTGFVKWLRDTISPLPNSEYTTPGFAGGAASPSAAAAGAAAVNPAYLPQSFSVAAPTVSVSVELDGEKLDKRTDVRIDQAHVRHNREAAAAVP